MTVSRTQQQQQQLSQQQMAQHQLAQQQLTQQAHPQQQVQPPQQVQPQQVQHTQVHHVHSAVAYQTCCGPFPKILVDKPRSSAFTVGVIMLCTGIVSFIIGIVGIFAGVHHVQVYYDGHHYQYIHRINPTAWFGANIWAGISVSHNETDPSLLT